MPVGPRSAVSGQSCCGAISLSPPRHVVSCQARRVRLWSDMSRSVPSIQKQKQNHMKLKYQKSKVSLLKSTEVKQVVSELMQIQREQLVILPEAVVKRAADPKSAMHRYFDWDDTSAAKKYRIWQARQLIAQVHVVDTESANQEPVRAFVHVKPEETDDDVYSQGYVATASIMRKPHFQAQVLHYAKEQLLRWRKNYGGFADFFGVVKEIDKIKL